MHEGLPNLSPFSLPDLVSRRLHTPFESPGVHFANRPGDSSASAADSSVGILSASSPWKMSGSDSAFGDLHVADTMSVESGRPLPDMAL